LGFLKKQTTTLIEQLAWGFWRTLLHGVRYLLCDDTEFHYVSMLSIQEYGEVPDSPRKLKCHPSGPDALHSTPGHKEDIK
jgi:hypothetical protein